MTTVLVPSYEIRKSSDPEPPKAVSPGDAVQYSIEVANTGTVAYTPTITDDLSDVLNDATYQGDAEARHRIHAPG